jgi:hypothetical protein
MMDEKFEWREVIRGLTDVEAWVTGIAYLGLIVRAFQLVSSRNLTFPV